MRFPVPDLLRSVLAELEDTPAAGLLAPPRNRTGAAVLMEFCASALRAEPALDALDADWSATSDPGSDGSRLRSALLALGDADPELGMPSDEAILRRYLAAQVALLPAVEFRP